MVNNKVKTIYIHAGMHKTGTSSIQATLAVNGAFLEKYSVYYPTQIAVNHSEFLVPMFMDNPNEYYLEKIKNMSDESIEEEYKFKTEILKSELLKIDVDTIVFSGEDIGKINKKDLQKMKSFLLSICPNSTIKFVLCLRNTSEYLNSLYQQGIKTGYQIVLLDKKSGLIGYKEKIELFQEIFEPNNLILYNFTEATKHSKGLVGFFLENILALKGFSEAELEIVRDNDSISDVAINVIDYINNITNSDTVDVSFSVSINSLNEKKLQYERYLNDTSALWSLAGDKFKLDKEYIESLYKKLEPELAWIKEKFNIDYSLSNAIYTEEKYKIPETFFKTIKIAFPKLSRILRRAFYDWLCEEIKIREDKNELQQLEQTKRWIENRFKDTVKENLVETKEKITREMDACKNFFAYFGIENKQNYQLYYHLNLFLKELGEYKVAKVMLQNFYEKNPHYNKEWSNSEKIQFLETCKNNFYGLFNINNDKKLKRACDVFMATFDITFKSNQELLEQTALLLAKYDLHVSNNSTLLKRTD